MKYKTIKNYVNIMHFKEYLTFIYKIYLYLIYIYILYIYLIYIYISYIYMPFIYVYIYIYHCNNILNIKYIQCKMYKTNSFLCMQ